MPRRTPLIIALLAVPLLLVGCAPAEPPVDRPGASEAKIDASEFGSDTRPGLDRYEDQRLTWKSCAPKTQCATFRAPLDWWRDEGGSITLTAARRRATGSRVGSIVVNPGGPGGSAVQLAASGSAVSRAVARRYDVVGLDPRGVGLSSPVECGATKNLDALIYSPTPGEIGSRTWIDASRTRSERLAAQCHRATGKVIDHVDSVSSARDLELLRHLLRSPKLDYVGYSYGTKLGQLYAGMFPDRVGRMVLDGVTDPWYSGKADASQAAGFERALRSYLGACIAGSPAAIGTGTCPFAGTVADASATVRSLLESARRAPFATSGGRPLTDSLLMIGIGAALYSQSTWPTLTAGLAGLIAGSPDGMMTLADSYWGRDTDGYANNSNEANLAISCPELDRTVAEDRRDFRRLERTAPVFGPYLAFQTPGCAGWTDVRAPLPAPIDARGADPILVVGTTRDPATTYREAQSVAARLDSGKLVTRIGDGHIAYQQGSACIDRTIDAFLLRGTVPAKDPRCTT